jgi:hypothetical protein
MQAAEDAALAQPADDVTATAADIAEAAAAAALDGPAAACEPVPAQEPVGGEVDDAADGFEFGSDAASDSSSSWDSSEEETDVPLTAATLPSWLARKVAAARCALAHACSAAVPCT